MKSTLAEKCWALKLTYSRIASDGQVIPPEWPYQDSNEPTFTANSSTANDIAETLKRKFKDQLKSSVLQTGISGNTWLCRAIYSVVPHLRRGNKKKTTQDLPAPDNSIVRLTMRSMPENVPFPTWHRRGTGWTKLQPRPSATQPCDQCPRHFHSRPCIIEVLDETIFSQDHQPPYYAINGRDISSPDLASSRHRIKQSPAKTIIAHPTMRLLLETFLLPTWSAETSQVEASVYMILAGPDA